MKKVLLVGTALLVAATGVASAASIDTAQSRQAKRIEHGRHTGTITWTEGLKLRAEQNRIANKEAALRFDGYLSKSDRRTLRAMQRDASKHIVQEKHDGWSRVWWLPRVGR
jgi:hypothetical protein